MTAATITIAIGSTDTERKYMCANDDCATFDPMRDQKIIEGKDIESKVSNHIEYKDCNKLNSRASSETSTTLGGSSGSEPNDMDSHDDDITSGVNNMSLRESEDPAGVEITNTLPAPRVLRFSTLTIREYARTLGDNVCVMGAPISLEWNHQGEVIYEIEDYEEAIQNTRRTQSELKMPSTHRNKILRESGFSAREIQEAVKKSNIARNQRKRTVEMLKMQPVHEAFEKMGRVGKKLHFGKKKVLT